jgi:O-antigen ligase
MFCSIVIHRLLLSTNSKVWDESIGVFLARENSSPKILLIILGLVGIILFSIFLKFIWIKASSPSRNILKWSGITTLIVGVLLSSLLLLPKLWEVSIEKMAPSENVVQQTLGTENTYTEEQAKYLPDLPEKGVGAGSGRAYIWKRAFELIKERPVFGYGMDTFAYHFPQDDPEKYANLEDYSVIVDKPHNIYIGLAFGGGLITLFGFLGIICFGLYRGFKWIITSSKLSENSITVALFVSAIAYFIQGLFNDSVIGVSTMMWIVFGLFISSVLKLEKNN